MNTNETHRLKSRVRVTSDKGVALERAYLYLAPHVWEALEEMMQEEGETAASPFISRVIWATYRQRRWAHDGRVSS